MTYRYNLQPADFRLPAHLGLAADAERDLRERAWALVVAGNHKDTEYFAELTHDEFGSNADVANSVLDAAVSARRAQQSVWGSDEPRTTLTAAFEELATIGVLARENFSCCGTCAPGEIAEERDSSRVWRGYVYFHMQDTEQLLESRDTYLGYGAFLDAWLSRTDWEALSDGEKDQRYTGIVLGLMDEAIEVLERHEIAVTWNRDLRSRIHLSNVDYYVAI